MKLLHSSVLLSLALLAASVSPALAAAPEQAAVARLVAETGGTAEIAYRPATGAVAFVEFEAGSLDLGLAADADRARLADAFLTQHGAIFGVRSPGDELRLVDVESDARGTSRAVYVQEHLGLPVFGTQLRIHFDAQGRVKAANGTFVAGVDVGVSPTHDSARAGKIALQAQGKRTVGRTVGVHDAELMVFRAGLVRGVEGEDHLVWRVEVGNGSDIREIYFVDAHDLRIVDRIAGIHTDLDRRAFDAQNQTAPGPNYPNNPFWEEGDSLPTGNTEADNMIFASGETYNFFDNAFGMDSFDGAGGTMDAIFNRGNGCPNASWNGTFISFCPGLTTDDVTAHEWGHAYTDFTHNLIYQWQSGALNESYSDIWGESVDQVNGRGTDTPAGTRTADNCEANSGSPAPSLTVNTGAAAGSYSSLRTANEPALPILVTADLALAVPASACTPVSGVSGRIAIIDWNANDCGSVTKTTNAFNAGAVGAIIVADPSGPIGLTGSASIATVQVLNEDGEFIKDNLPGNATIEIVAGTDTSVRWLMGEDVTPGGAIRDMWNPTCFGDPGKVTDKTQFICNGDVDGGGVHINSGIPNHAFALLVDGGTYNGRTVAPIGMSKAVQIYFRAMTVYQTPVTDFANHADAMMTSCGDLVGMSFPDVSTARGDVTITAGDCDQVEEALLAVEMWTPPSFCGFDLVLETPAPILSCDAVFTEDFEAEPVAWTLTNFGVTPADYTPRDWEWTDSIPAGGDGRGMFAINDVALGTCEPGGDESGAMRLDSPSIVLPGDADNAVLTFDHWVATEAGYDGGNLKISVNDGPFTLIEPEDFHFNPYNGTLEDSGTNTNPLESQPAFQGANDGSSGSGSWGQSQIFLANYASGGDSIEIRFELGVDGCNGAVGWYVDNVNVCGSALEGLFLDGFESGDTSAW